MTFRQLFFIEGKFLGATDLPETQPKELTGGRQGKLFYCHACGVTYALCPVTRNGKTLTFEGVWGTCKSCKSCRPHSIPGSIWHYHTEFTQSFPMEVMLHELNCLIHQHNRVYPNDRID